MLADATDRSLTSRRGRMEGYTMTATADVLEKLLTLPQVAQELSLRYQVCYGLVTSGQIPARLFAGRWVVTVEDLQQFQRERGHKKTT